MGFRLALCAVVGLLKNVLCHLVLSAARFGLPLLDVSFYRCAPRCAASGGMEAADAPVRGAFKARSVAVKIALCISGHRRDLCFMGVIVARFVLAGDIPLALQYWRRWRPRAASAASGFLLFFSVARVLMRRGEDEVVPEEIEAFGVMISPVTMREAMDKIETSSLIVRLIMS
jgi:hypothetical protein